MRKFLTVKLDSTELTPDGARSQLMILDYVKIPRLDWNVLQLTSNNKGDEARFIALN